MNSFINLFKSKKRPTDINTDIEVRFMDKEVLPSLDEPPALPRHIEDFNEYHIKVLRRLNKHPEKQSFSGLITLQVDIPNFIPILHSLGLIGWAPYEDALSYSTVETLKKILKYFHLKVSGNKKELVNRIFENIPYEEALKCEDYSDYYICTEKGLNLINASYDNFFSIKCQFFKECIDLILANQLDVAYRKICKRNAEMPVPPGLDCNWDKRYFSGIPRSELSLYQSRISESNNKLITAASIYGQMSGDTLHDIERYLSQVYQVSMDVPMQETTLDLRYERSLESTDRDFASYESSGIEKYRFLAALDEYTCPICGALDGKIFPVSEREIGVNCPPMHKGCRCTTVSVTNEEWLEHMTRYSRDLVTKKVIHVPATMNWSEWKKKYMGDNS